MRSVLAILFSVASIATAQGPTIELRKARTLVDPDGRSFTRAPGTITPISGGRYALAEMNELPMVVDSTGRLVQRFVRGDGPGGFSGYTDAIVTGPGDSIYAANGGRIHVFDGTLKYVRSIVGISANWLVPVSGGFVTSARWYAGQGMISSVGFIDEAGRRIRFLVSDTIARPQDWPPPSSYVLGPADGRSFWAASPTSHRLERWSVDGTRTTVIDMRPAWFVIPARPAPMPTVQALREVDGVLWVMSRVPVPNTMDIIREATRRNGGALDTRTMPIERLSTTYLEAYDAATGRQLAETPINAFGVAILDGDHFVIHTPSANDTAQLEIWEMRLKR
jgi:hypothetical protein